jgi:hypothetical protein
LFSQFSWAIVLWMCILSNESVRKTHHELDMISWLTPAAGDSGSAAEGMQRAGSGAIIQSAIPCPAAAPEPNRWAAQMDQRTCAW